MTVIIGKDKRIICSAISETSVIHSQLGPENTTTIIVCVAMQQRVQISVGAPTLGQNCLHVHTAKNSDGVFKNTSAKNMAKNKRSHV